MTIDEISIAVGYENYISFIMLAQNVHMTPSEYRMKKEIVNEPVKRYEDLPFQKKLFLYLGSVWYFVL